MEIPPILFFPLLFFIRPLPQHFLRLFLPFSLQLTHTQSKMEEEAFSSFLHSNSLVFLTLSLFEFLLFASDR